MRFNLNFVKEFIEIDIEPEKLANLLTMAGMEVEYIEKLDDDWIFDIEVTSNRCDWLSIIGIAREISIVLNKKLNLKYPKVIKKPILKDREIIIEDYNDCPLYIGRVIRNVKVEESKEYFLQILKCNINRVNNIVDITNYSMLKWGNPLHAFDEDKIEGNIYIRRAKENEEFIGIDKKRYILSNQNLVIADDKKVIALAGVMGAKNTEITPNTKNVFLEAAIFSPVVIRRSRRALGINTESSYRFERKVFAEYLEFASSEASQLMKEFAGGIFCGYKIIQKRQTILDKKIKKILFSQQSLNSYLGSNFSKNRIQGLLKRLKFKTKLSKDKFIVYSPKYRLDIERDVDIYEEIARLYGYDKIEHKIPFIFRDQKIISNYDFKNELKNLLVNLGFNEIITYSIVAQKELEILKENNFIRLANPLREEDNALRPNLVLSMIKTISYNINRNRGDLKFFELANIYFKENSRIYQKPMLTISTIGDLENFFYLKGAVEEILKYLSIEKFYFSEDLSNNLKIFKDDIFIGVLGKLNKDIIEKFDLKTNIFFANLDVEVLEKLKGDRYYRPFSIYPAIWHDISIVVSSKIKFKDIEGIIRSKPYVVDIKIVDIYQLKEKKFNTFTIRIFYQSDEKTLTSQEVNTIHNSIREELSKQKGIALR